jgi:uncharacterized protein (TIGR02246 family)
MKHLRVDRIALGTIRVLAILLSLGAPACRSAQNAARASASAPSTRSYDALAAATAHYAALLRSAQPESVATSFTLDGELILPGASPLRGRTAIARFLAPLAKTTTVVSVEMRPDSQRIAGTSAQQGGRYVQVAGPRGKPAQTYRGTYDALWRLDADGRWRFVRLTMRLTP